VVKKGETKKEQGLVARGPGHLPQKKKKRAKKKASKH